MPRRVSVAHGDTHERTIAALKTDAINLVDCAQPPEWNSQSSLADRVWLIRVSISGNLWRIPFFMPVVLRQSLFPRFQMPSAEATEPPFFALQALIPGGLWDSQHIIYQEYFGNH